MQQEKGLKKTKIWYKGERKDRVEFKQRKKD